MALATTVGLALGLGLWPHPGEAGPPEDVAGRRLYTEHCAACHGAGRQGHTGPALLPESLAGLRKPVAVETITHGRPGTAMPAFAGVLSSDLVIRLTEYLYAAPPEMPMWGLGAMQASRTVLAPLDDLPSQPVFSADPGNLFAVIEADASQLQVVDGATLTPLARVPVRFGVLAPPLSSADGRFLWLISRDGWVQRYDVWGLRMLAEVRVGLHGGTGVLSDDGRVLAVATAVPAAVTLLNADDLTPLKTLALTPLADPVATTALAGERPGRISALRQVPGRGRFVVGLREAPGVWEIGPGPGFAVRRLGLEFPVDDLVVTPDSRHLVGVRRDTGRGFVLGLDSGTLVATFDLPGGLRLETPWLREQNGRREWLFASSREETLLRLDLETWNAEREGQTLGPGQGLYAHPAGGGLWLDAALGPRRDSVAVLDPVTLERQAILTPSPGKTVSHVGFSHNGRVAAVSVAEPAPEGAVVFYDTRTLKEIRRLPAARPLGATPVRIQGPNSENKS